MSSRRRGQGKPSRTRRSVSGVIVSLQEQFYLVVGWVDIDSVETRLELVLGELSIPNWLIEDVESVEEIEVTLVGEVDLASLKLLLEVAELFERVDKLILVMESQNRLSEGERRDRLTEALTGGGSLGASATLTGEVALGLGEECLMGEVPPLRGEAGLGGGTVITGLGAGTSGLTYSANSA